MMKSQCWNSAVLLLLLTPDLFYSPSSFPFFLPHLAHAVPTLSPVTPHRILYVTNVGSDDYDDDYSEGGDHSTHPPRTPPISTAGPEPTLCDYDPCMEQQVPCKQLSAQDGCLCPGLTGPDEPPHAPLLKKLVPAGNGEMGAEVWWCAPESVVSSYRVVVEGQEGRSLNFRENLRSGLIGELPVGVKVCVEAVNEGGTSVPEENSCQTYNAQEPYNQTLRAGVIGGGVGFLLLLSVSAVICWRWRFCRKARGNSTEGLGNPSYSTEGTF